MSDEKKMDEKNNPPEGDKIDQAVSEALKQRIGLKPTPESTKQKILDSTTCGKKKGFFTRLFGK